MSRTPANREALSFHCRRAKVNAVGKKSGGLWGRHPLVRRREIPRLRRPDALREWKKNRCAPLGMTVFGMEWKEKENWTKLPRTEAHT
jgi:hypothetical protein